MSEIKLTYNEVVIRYDEKLDRWLFNLRGRDRSAASLVAAKHAIDATARGESTFKRFEAWVGNYYSDELKKVEVTSICERSSFGGRAILRVVFPGGKGRREVRADTIFPCSPDNIEIMRKISEVSAQLKPLLQRRVELKRSLKCYVAPKEPVDQASHG
jgi:hypothetical protein